MTSLTDKWELLQKQTKITETRANRTDERICLYLFQNLQCKLPMLSWLRGSHYFSNDEWILFHSWYVNWDSRAGVDGETLLDVLTVQIDSYQNMSLTSEVQNNMPS